jgi:hypothetical protein
MIKREVREGRLVQGEDEQIAYTITTTPWGSNPTSPSATLYDVTVSGVRTDVSSSRLAGVASALGDVVTTPRVFGLEAHKLYRLEVQWTCSGNVFECYVDIQAEH